MNPEKPLVFVPGENLKALQGIDYVKKKSQSMGPHSKISSIATGIVLRDKAPTATVIFLNGETGAGVESKQMEEYMLSRFPAHSGRTITETKSYDTSTSAKAAANIVQSNPVDYAAVVVPIEHKRRTVGQFKAWGVTINEVFESNSIYVNDPGVTENTRKRRMKIVKKLYLHPQMWIFEIPREIGMNLVGIVNRKGILISKISRKNRAGFQKNSQDFSVENPSESNS